MTAQEISAMTDQTEMRDIQIYIRAATKQDCDTSFHRDLPKLTPRVRDGQ